MQTCAYLSFLSCVCFTIGIIHFAATCRALGRRGTAAARENASKSRATDQNFGQHFTRQSQQQQQHGANSAATPTATPVEPHIINSSNSGSSGSTTTGSSNATASGNVAHKRAVLPISGNVNTVTPAIGPDGIELVPMANDPAVGGKTDHTSSLVFVFLKRFMQARDLTSLCIIPAITTISVLH